MVLSIMYKKTLNLSHACSERTRLLGLRYIRVSRISIVIRLTDFYDFICREQKSLTRCEQLSLKTQLFLSIIYKKPLNLSLTNSDRHD